MFKPLALRELPKREGPKRRYDEESASALLAIVSVAGSTATDGFAYTVQKDARATATRAKRLLRRVAPELVVETRIYRCSDDGTPVAGGSSYGWCIFLPSES